MKPIASGCEETASGLRNDDARQLQRASQRCGYELVNPFAFLPAIAPHIAAAQVGRNIDLDAIGVAFERLRAESDVVVVEGAGGFRVPLALEGETIAAIPRRLNLGVVLVVAIRLGCLNHALLTAEAIRSDDLPLCGWVANCADESASFVREQIETLELRLQAPLLGILPRFDGVAPPAPERVAARLDVEALLKRLHASTGSTG